MEMYKLLLQQAADALDNLRLAHHSLIEWYPKTAPTSDQLLSQDRLFEADRELFQQLIFAVPICALYAAQYAGEAHRYSRVASVLDQCCVTHRDLSEAFIVFVSKTGATHPARVHQQFKTAGKILVSAQSSLKKLIAQSSVVNGFHHENAICVGKQGDEPMDGKHEQDATLSAPAEYLRDRSRYEFGRQALCLKGYMTHVELNSLIAERLRSPFQRFPHTYKPIYRAIEENSPWISGTNNEGAWHLVCDHVNAVWYSMLAASLVENRGEEEYTKIYRAARRIKADELADSLEDRYVSFDPVSLAKGLQATDVWLGIIFMDDPGTIVWPLGKSSTIQRREVIVCCDARPYGINKYSFSYQGLKLLNLGQKAVRPPRMDHSFSTTSIARWSIRLRRSLYDDDDPYKSWSSPFGVRAICSILAFVRQSSPAYKPFPFLQLPAELRNKVYDEYLSHWNMAPRMTRCKFDFDDSYGTILVPELCQASHQLLSEVLLLHLARKPFEFQLGRAIGRWFPLGVQSVLHDFLKFRNVNFTAEPSFRVKLSLKDDKPGFTINWELDERAFSPPNPAMFEQLKTLMSILTEDTTSDGLTLADISAIHEFLSGHAVYEMRLMGSRHYLSQLEVP